MGRFRTVAYFEDSFGIIFHHPRLFFKTPCHPSTYIPVSPHPRPELARHLLVAMHVDQVPEADVRHVDEGVVYTVQVRPVGLNLRAG